MKTFLTMPLKAVVAVAVLTLLSGAKQAPAPQDVDYEASACPQFTKDKAGEQRSTLIRGMI